MTLFTQDVETWPNHFLERMEEYTKLSDFKKESNKEWSKKKPPIDLGSDTCFDTF